MIERVIPTLAAEVREVVRLGVLVAPGARNGVASPALDEKMAAREAEIRAAWTGRTAGEIPELQSARALYRDVGIDPTRQRPSSEALARRVLRGNALPRINPAVDACNLSAVTYFLPIGLHDLSAVTPPLHARLGAPGEWYEGLGKPRVNLEGRFCLSDADGAFGNPSSDSRRASVGPDTEALLWIVYAPADYATDALLRHLAWSERLLVETGLVAGEIESALAPAS